MSRDPYEILGVGKTAAADEIRSAYRKLAKKLHPDLNPGDKAAEEKFKELAGAYDLLSDVDKRGRFDRGEIDASGDERPQQRYYRDYAGQGAGGDRYTSEAGYADFADDDDILSEIFRRRGGGEGATVRMRGQDVHYRFPVEFLDGVNGATRQVTMPDGGVLDVKIPPGTRDGQMLRLRGKGLPGFGGGPPGDALVEVEQQPHAYFTRKGDDIHLELPITLAEAVLGARVEVPTPTGRVAMTIPKGSSAGRQLRLRGKGVRRADGSHGDEYLTLKIVLPEQPDAALEAFVDTWPGKAYDPRKSLER